MSVVASPPPPAPALDAVVELARLWIERALCLQAARNPTPTTQSRYAVGAAEVVRILTGARTPAEADERVATLDEGIERAWRAITRAERSPLAALIGAFDLDDTAARVIAALLAPEISADLERACAYAWDDFTRKRPDVGFLCLLVGGRDPAARDRVRRALGPDSTLRRARVVLIAGGGAPDAPPFVNRTVRLADRVVDHLRGDEQLDEALEALCRVAEPLPALDEMVIAPVFVDQTRRALTPGTAGAPRVLIYGPPGCGKSMLACALAREAGRPVLRVDLPAILRDDERMADRIGRVWREASLRGAWVLLRGGAEIASDVVRRATAERFADLLRHLGTTVVITAHTRPAWLAPQIATLVEVALRTPNLVERIELWRRALPSDTPLADPADVELISGRYAFTGGSIARAAERAAARARLEAPADPRITRGSLSDAARLLLSHNLGSVAERIPPGFVWADLVLPDDTLERIREVVSFAQRRAYLLEAWGFAKKLPYGRGVSAILAGPPGTGKTMVAQLLSNELGYDLFRIDLAQVVNKYIGETEKNLARVFDEAEASHAILFFDEADALFAKRTEVKSSTDRYANLEVNYLLQRMETYDGVTLLATNLAQGVDEAFKRRVRFTVEFEMPEAPERLRLWKSMFPPEAPLATEIDWDRLAQRYEMAGGYIKKAAVRAALMAVERGLHEPISFADLDRAAQLEYREMGRII
jgi:SpoVK/Ycf46/Vps4 family AAA+-type ATPase